MASQISESLPLCDPNISHYPDNPAIMSPREASYREQYRNFSELLSHESEYLTAVHAAEDECKKADEILLRSKNVLFAVNMLCFFVLLTAVVVLPIFLDGEIWEADTWRVLIFIISVALFILFTKIPRNARDSAESRRCDAERNKTECTKKLNDFESTKVSSANSIEHLKNEFSQWANDRNNFIKILSEKKFFEYMGFPFEPLLDKNLYAVGTDEEPTKYTVYSKHKYFRSSYSSYRYHVSMACVPESQYVKPIAFPVEEAQNMHMSPCQTCSRNKKFPEWILSIKDKYSHEIEILEKHDIHVSINAHMHTEVYFLIGTNGRELAPPYKKTHTNHQPQASEHNESSDIQELRSEINRLIAEKNAAEENHKKELKELQSQLEQKTYADNLFQYALRNMETNGDRLFYNYPSVRDFYRQVTDRRFHRSLIEDIKFDGKITIEAMISSSGKPPYKTTLTSCNCGDRQMPCKHMLFLAYQTGILLIHKQKVEDSMKIYLDELRATKPKK